MPGPSKIPALCSMLTAPSLTYSQDLLAPPIYNHAWIARFAGTSNYHFRASSLTDRCLGHFKKHLGLSPAIDGNSSTCRTGRPGQTGATSSAAGGAINSRTNPQPTTSLRRPVEPNNPIGAATLYLCTKCTNLTKPTAGSAHLPWAVPNLVSVHPHGCARSSAAHYLTYLRTSSEPKHSTSYTLSRQGIISLPASTELLSLDMNAQVHLP